MDKLGKFTIFMTIITLCLLAASIYLTVWFWWVFIFISFILFELMLLVLILKSIWIDENLHLKFKKNDKENN